MEKRVFIIMQVDLIYYPPALTLLKTLCDLKYTPIYIGEYSDQKQKEELQERGVRFIDAPVYRAEYTSLHKFIKLQQFKRFVYHTLAQLYHPDSDLVWLIDNNDSMLLLLNKVVRKYKTVIQLYEFTLFQNNKKRCLLNLFFNPYVTLQQAYKVVCCEYNRAQIIKGIYQLDTLPCILPNKPYDESSDTENLPDSIRTLVADLSKKTANKRVLLYQGIFIQGERRLDEFCEAMSLLPNNYIFLIMGPANAYYEKLKARYQSDKILFLPFIKPPYHMQITRMATIGITTYFQKRGNLSQIIGTLYCAPNKIFEYARYGVPMIGNDIPGLYYEFSQYKCGVCIAGQLTARNIVDAVCKIEADYSTYAEGARNYYDSIQLTPIVKQIVEA